MHLHFFTCNQRTLYRQYLSLKASIFGCAPHSQGVALEPHSQFPEPDEADRSSLFLACIRSDGSMVGIIRATPLWIAFPHRDYFSMQLDEDGMQYLERSGFTMNALGVQKRFRGYDRGHVVECRGVTYKSISLALVSCMSQLFFENNYDICVITAIPGISVTLCQEIGFEQLGRSFVFENRDRHLLNLFKMNPYRDGFGRDQFMRSIHKGLKY